MLTDLFEGLEASCIICMVFLILQVTSHIVAHGVQPGERLLIYLLFLCGDLRY